MVSSTDSSQLHPADEQRWNDTPYGYARDIFARLVEQQPIPVAFIWSL
jgi:hypothetical protein